jgi:hypothetical protein
VQLGFYWLANAMLVALGLYLMNAWRGLAVLEQGGRALWRHIAPPPKPDAGRHRQRRIGALWGWLPCGMVYSVLLTAMLSGSAADGAAVMLAFGLGTLPMLTGLGLLGARLQPPCSAAPCASPAACWCWASACWAWRAPLAASRRLDGSAMPHTTPISHAAPPATTAASLCPKAPRGPC